MKGGWGTKLADVMLDYRFNNITPKGKLDLACFIVIMHMVPLPWIPGPGLGKHNNGMLKPIDHPPDLK